MTNFRPRDKQMANSMSQFQDKTARSYIQWASIPRYAPLLSPPPSPPQRKCLTAWNFRLDVLTDEIMTESEKLKKKSWQPKDSNYNFSLTQDNRMNSIATHEATSRTCSRQHSGKAEALARREVESKDWDGTGSYRTNSDKSLNSFFIYVSAMHLWSLLYFFPVCTCAKQETSHVISVLPVKWQKHRTNQVLIDPAGTASLQGKEFQNLNKQLLLF